MANKPRMNYTSCLARLKKATRDRKISDYLWEMLSLQVLHFEKNPEILNDLKIKDMLDLARLCREYAQLEEIKEDKVASQAFEERLKELQRAAS